MAAQMGISVLPATIAAGQAISAEIDLGAMTLVGIVMPPAWTAAGMTFQISPDGGATWVEHTNSAGAATNFVVGGGQYIAVDPALWRGVYSMKVRSGTVGAPVNQTVGAALQLICRFVS